VVVERRREKNVKENEYKINEQIFFIISLIHRSTHEETAPLNQYLDGLVE
jgi:hypothetical protein